MRADPAFLLLQLIGIIVTAPAVALIFLTFLGIMLNRMEAKP